MSPDIRPDHAAIYIRWSTEDQGDGTTLAVQSEACHHYVLSQGWEIRDDLLFIDDGYSGGSLARPAMTRLRAAVQGGQVDCVVVFRLDRLSRSVIDTVTLVLQEWADLTHVKSAREPVDTTTAMGRQFFYMLVSYAEWERNVIRERMFSGKLRRAREGRSPGMPAPYGYRRGPTPGLLALVEGEAAVVRQVFAMAGAGHSVRSIAACLNRQGIPARKGGLWSTSMLSKLLHNPVYTGALVWGRRQLNPRYGKAPGEPKHRAAEPHVRMADSTIPAILAREQFDRVQQLLHTRGLLPPRAAGSPHLLAGLIRCGRCGSSLQFNRYDTWAYYRCAGKGAAGGCDAPAIPALPLEEAVGRLVCDRYGALAAASLRAEQRALQRSRQAEQQTGQVRIAARRQQLAASARRVDHDYLSGTISAAERRQLLTQLATESARLREAEQALREEPPHSPQKANEDDPWVALTVAEQKQLLPLLVASLSAVRESPRQVRLAITWLDSASANERAEEQGRQEDGAEGP